MEKGSILKARKFWELIPTFVEVTGKKPGQNKMSMETPAEICTSDHMFKRENWDKFRKMNKVKFSPNFMNKYVIPG